MITVTPTLSSTSGYLVDVRDQIANLLRFIIMNPGRTSSLWESDLISFRTLSARYQGVRSSLVDALNTNVSKACRRMFPDYNFDINFSTSDYDSENDDGRYTVSFEIMLIGTDVDHPEEQSSALISGNISADDNTHEIELKFNNGIDNALLTSS